jgi:hypothetical protein
MTMNRTIQTFLWVGIAALSLAPWALAQSVTLTSAGNNVADGVYVSPYYATVNGVPNTPIVCDDFADESYLNASWSASSTSFSSLSASNIPTAWGAELGASAATLKLYEEAAWLTLGVLRQAAGSPGQINYSFAVWAVFDPSGVASWLLAYGDTTTYNAVFGPGGLLAGLPTSFSLSEFSNVLILTPEVAGGTCTAGSCPEQEFIEVVPEGGAALGYLFLAGLCCSGAILMRSRRPLSNIGAA